MEYFRVTARGAIRLPRKAGGGYLKPGTRIERSQIKKWEMESSLDSLLASGFLVWMHEIEADKHGYGPDVTPPKPVPAESDHGVVTHDRGEKIAVTQRTSLWDADPASLQGKDLDALNVMIQELDASVEPFATEAEAIAWLSQDFDGDANVATG